MTLPAVDTSSVVRHRSRAESEAVGLRARRSVSPDSVGDLRLPVGRRDAVQTALDVARRRLVDLVPLRHQRMAASPFAFLRGNALGMAADLAGGSVSGIPVQLCGDAHLSNFGVFASPERRLLFDLNDFDETFPGPWEWDVQRLVASMAVAGRQQGFSAKERRGIVRGTVRRYRAAMAEFAAMTPLDVWYARADPHELRELVGRRMNRSEQQRVDKALAKAQRSDRMKAMAKLTEVVDGGLRFKTAAPLLTRLTDLLPEADSADLRHRIERLLQDYKRSLPDPVGVLLGRYETVDVARKVVGVGSVGTRCWVVLLRGVDERDPLFLQVKEATESSLAKHVPETMLPGSPTTQQGERVVHGQKLMQAAGDIFLGWHTSVGEDGVERDFYVRQLKDMKFSAAVETMDVAMMKGYGAVCGWTLARAHARSGDPIAIAAYLGEDDGFAAAMSDFAETYANLNERDHAEFSEAVRGGRLVSSPAQ